MDVAEVQNETIRYENLLEGETRQTRDVARLFLAREALVDESRRRGLAFVNDLPSQKVPPPIATSDKVAEEGGEETAEEGPEVEVKAFAIGDVVAWVVGGKTRQGVVAGFYQFLGSGRLVEVESLDDASHYYVELKNGNSEFVKKTKVFEPISQRTEAETPNKKTATKKKTKGPKTPKNSAPAEESSELSAEILGLSAADPTVAGLASAVVAKLGDKGVFAAFNALKGNHNVRSLKQLAEQLGIVANVTPAPETEAVDLEVVNDVAFPMQGVVYLEPHEDFVREGADAIASLESVGLLSRKKENKDAKGYRNFLVYQTPEGEVRAATTYYTNQYYIKDVRKTPEGSDPDRSRKNQVKLEDLLKENKPLYWGSFAQAAPRTFNVDGIDFDRLVQDLSAQQELLTSMEKLVNSGEIKQAYSIMLGQALREEGEEIDSRMDDMLTFLDRLGVLSQKYRQEGSRAFFYGALQTTDSIKVLLKKLNGLTQNPDNLHEILFQNGKTGRFLNLFTEGTIRELISASRIGDQVDFESRYFAAAQESSPELQEKIEKALDGLPEDASDKDKADARDSATSTFLRGKFRTISEMGKRWLLGPLGFKSSDLGEESLETGGPEGGGVVVADEGRGFEALADGGRYISREAFEEITEVVGTKIERGGEKITIDLETAIARYLNNSKAVHRQGLIDIISEVFGASPSADVAPLTELAVKFRVETMEDLAEVDRDVQDSFNALATTLLVTRIKNAYENENFTEALDAEEQERQRLSGDTGPQPRQLPGSPEPDRVGGSQATPPPSAKVPTIAERSQPTEDRTEPRPISAEEVQMFAAAMQSFSLPKSKRAEAAPQYLIEGSGLGLRNIDQVRKALQSLSTTDGVFIVYLNDLGTAVFTQTPLPEGASPKKIQTKWDVNESKALEGNPTEPPRVDPQINEEDAATDEETSRGKKTRQEAKKEKAARRGKTEPSEGGELSAGDQETLDSLEIMARQLTEEVAEVNARIRREMAAYTKTLDKAVAGRGDQYLEENLVLPPDLVEEITKDTSVPMAEPLTVNAIRQNFADKQAAVVEILREFRESKGIQERYSMGVPGEFTDPILSEATLRAALDGMGATNITIQFLPHEGWEGRLVLDGEGSPLQIQINSGRIRGVRHLGDVVMHELAEWASAEEDLTSLVSSLTSSERAEIDETIRDLGYPDVALGTETTARAVETLARAWGTRSWFQRIVARIQTFLQRFGMPRTRAIAELVAARAIATSRNKLQFLNKVIESSPERPLNYRHALSKKKRTFLGLNEEDVVLSNLIERQSNLFAGVQNAEQLERRMVNIFSDFLEKVRDGKFLNKGINEDLYGQIMGGANGELDQQQKDQLLRGMHKSQERIFDKWLKELAYLGTADSPIGGSPSEGLARKFVTIQSAVKERVVPQKDGSFKRKKLGGNADALPYTPFPELVSRLIRELGDPVNQGKRVSQLIYETAQDELQKMLEGIPRRESPVVAEMASGENVPITWVRFSSSAEDPDTYERNVVAMETLSATSESIYPGCWCTGLGSAAGYLDKGSFYIGYDAQQLARIAVQVTEQGTGEVRGVRPGQRMEPEMVPVVMEHLRSSEDLTDSSENEFVADLLLKTAVEKADETKGITLQGIVDAITSADPRAELPDFLSTSGSVLAFLEENVFEYTGEPGYGFHTEKDLSSPDGEIRKVVEKEFPDFSARRALKNIPSLAEFEEAFPQLLEYRGKPFPLTAEEWVKEPALESLLVWARRQPAPLRQEEVATFVSIYLSSFDFVGAPDHKRIVLALSGGRPGEFGGDGDGSAFFHHRLHEWFDVGRGLIEKLEGMAASSEEPAYPFTSVTTEKREEPEDLIDAYLAIARSYAMEEATGDKERDNEILFQHIAKAIEDISRATFRYDIDPDAVPAFLSSWDLDSNPIDRVRLNTYLWRFYGDAVPGLDLKPIVEGVKTNPVDGSSFPRQEAYAVFLEEGLVGLFDLVQTAPSTRQAKSYLKVLLAVDIENLNRLSEERSVEDVIKNKRFLDGLRDEAQLHDAFRLQEFLPSLTKWLAQAAESDNRVPLFGLVDLIGATSEILRSLPFPPVGGAFDDGTKKTFGELLAATDLAVDRFLKGEADDIFRENDLLSTAENVVGIVVRGDPYLEGSGLSRRAKALQQKTYEALFSQRYESLSSLFQGESPNFRTLKRRRIFDNNLPLYEKGNDLFWSYLAEKISDANFEETVATMVLFAEAISHLEKRAAANFFKESNPDESLALKFLKEFKRKLEDEGEDFRTRVLERFFEETRSEDANLSSFVGSPAFLFISLWGIPEFITTKFTRAWFDLFWSPDKESPINQSFFESQAGWEPWTNPDPWLLSEYWPLSPANRAGKPDHFSIDQSYLNYLLEGSINRPPNVDEEFLLKLSDFAAASAENERARGLRMGGIYPQEEELAKTAIVMNRMLQERVTATLDPDARFLTQLFKDDPDSQRRYRDNIKKVFPASFRDFDTYLSAEEYITNRPGYREPRVLKHPGGPDRYDILVWEEDTQSWEPLTDFRGLDRHEMELRIARGDSPIFLPKDLKTYIYDEGTNGLVDDLDEPFFNPSGPGPETDNGYWSLEDPESHKAQATERLLAENEANRFVQVVGRLKQLGVDVRILSQNTGTDFTAMENGAAIQMKSGDRLVYLVVSDLTQPSGINLRVALHEATHTILGKQDPRVVRAAGEFMREYLDRPITDAGNPVEVMTEGLAAKLQKEGFEESASLARSIIDALIEAYRTMILNIQLAMGRTPSPEAAARYLEHKMRRFLSGQYSGTSIFSHIGGPVPSLTNRLGYHKPAPGELPEAILTRDGWVVPEVFPDRVDDVEFSLQMRPPSHLQKAVNDVLSNATSYATDTPVGEWEKNFLAPRGEVSYEAAVDDPESAASVTETRRGNYAGTADEALKKIKESSQEPGRKELATLLGKMAKTARIDLKKVPMILAPEASDLLGRFSPGVSELTSLGSSLDSSFRFKAVATPLIEINSNEEGNTEATVLHEITHAVTFSLLETLPLTFEGVWDFNDLPPALQQKFQGKARDLVTSRGVASVDASDYLNAPQTRALFYEAMMSGDPTGELEIILDTFNTQGPARREQMEGLVEMVAMHHALVKTVNRSLFQRVNGGVELDGRLEGALARYEDSGLDPNNMFTEDPNEANPAEGKYLVPVNRSDTYSLSNLHEFVSGFFENTALWLDPDGSPIRMHDLLRKINWPSSPKQGGFFSRLLRAIKQILRIPEGSGADATLNNLIKITSIPLATSKPLLHRVLKKPKAGSPAPDESPEKATARSYAVIAKELDRVYRNMAKAAGMPPQELLQKYLRNRVPGDMLEATASAYPDVVNTTLEDLGVIRDKTVQHMERKIASTRKLLQKIQDKNNRAIEKDDREFAKASKALGAVLDVINNDEVLNVSLKDKLRVLRQELGNLQEGSRIGGVIQEIEAQMGNLRGAPIPDFYFEALEGMSQEDPAFFVEALAALDLDWKKLSNVDAITQLKGWAGNKNAGRLTNENRRALQILVTDNKLMATFVAFAKANQLDVDVLGSRWDNAFDALNKNVEDVSKTSDEALQEVLAELDSIPAIAARQDRVKRELSLRRRKITTLRNRRKRIEQRNAEINKMLRVLTDEIETWRAELGAYAHFDAAPGQPYMEMDPVAGGEIKARHVLSNDPADAEDMWRTVYVSNRGWLESNKDQQGTSLYTQVEQVTNRLMYEIMFDHAHLQTRSFINNRLSSISELFGDTGTQSGKNVRRRMLRWENILKQLDEETSADARRWSAAAIRAAKAAGYGGSYRQFLEEIRNPVTFALENEVGINSDTAFARKAVDLANSLLAKAPPVGEIDPEFSKVFVDLLFLDRDIARKLDAKREELGVAIEDPMSSIIDPVTGKTKTTTRLRGVRQGATTVPRKVDMPYLTNMFNMMQELGWGREEGQMNLFATLAELRGQEVETGQEVPPEDLAQILAPLVEATFPERVVDRFLEPSIRHNVSLFKGFEPSQVIDAWDTTGGNILNFFGSLYERREQEDEETLASFLLRNFGAIHAQYKRYDTVMTQTGRNRDPLEAQRRDSYTAPHFLTDARSNVMFPSEFFQYVEFEPQVMVTHISQLALNAAFGRGGSELDVLMERVVGEIEARLEELRPGSKERVRMEDLAKSVHTWKTEIENWFTTSDVGPGADMRLFGETVSTLVSNVLNNPKTGAMQLLTPAADFSVFYRGVNGYSLKGSKEAIKAFSKSLSGSFLGDFLKMWTPEQTIYEKWIADMLLRNRENMLDFKTFMSNKGREGQLEEGLTNAAIKGMKGWRRLLDKPWSRGRATSYGGFSPQGIFGYIGGLANYSTSVGHFNVYYDLVKQIVKHLRDFPEDMENPRFSITSERMLRKFKKFGWGSEETLKIFRSSTSDFLGKSIEDLARDVARRQDAGVPELTKAEVTSIMQIAENHISLNASINNRPSAIMSGPFRHVFPLWGWPLRRMKEINDGFTDEQGQMQWHLAMGQLATLAFYVAPIGVAWTLLSDWYDEILQGKQSNLRKLDWDNPVSINNFLAATERMSRAGTYGMGGDLFNEMVNWTDPSGSGARTFSLDDRVLFMSAMHNVIGGMRNILNQRGATYETVGRPMMQALGGNGLLHLTNITNNFFETEAIPFLGEFTEAERRVNTKINVNNILRAAGRANQIELKGGGGYSSPTPMSMWVRRMQLAAYMNDREEFLKAYRFAVEAASSLGKENPESSVKRSFSSRHPLRSTFRQKPSDADVARMLASLHSPSRRDVQEAIALHEKYDELIGASSSVGRTSSAVRKTKRGGGGSSIPSLEGLGLDSLDIELPSLDNVAPRLSSL